MGRFGKKAASLARWHIACLGFSDFSLNVVGFTVPTLEEALQRNLLGYWKTSSQPLHHWVGQRSGAH